MSKVDLKNVLRLMIDEETDKANALLEKWLNQKTSELHEEILSEDDHEDSIDQDQKNTKSEEYFDENDVDDNEDSSEKEVPDDVTDVSTDPNVINDQFTDLQNDLARLKKEFDELTSSSDQETDEVNSEDQQDKDSTVQEGLEMKPVKNNSNADGIEVGSKTAIKGNKRSALPAKNSRTGGKPVQTKNPTAKGFNRETAPDVKDAKVGSNARKKWSDDTKTLPREGDPKAELNKNYSKENDKSVLGNGSK